MEPFFHTLELVNNFIWGHLAFALIIGLGSYFSIRSRFFQVRRFGSVIRSFISFFKEKTTRERGIHPLKAFFAAIGGCIGIGNVVGICTAVQIGGPGALFWTWVGGFFGMLIQYSEVYLGIKYRVKNQENNYDGGPMFYLPFAYKTKWVAYLAALLLCIYGIEIFMFNVMADSMAVNWNIDQRLVIAALLAAIMIVALGGIKRVGEVCSALIPGFVILYSAMSLWVLIAHTDQIPRVLQEIFQGAFTKQAATGGFAGSTLGLTISMGLSRGAYSGDIGIGYTSIIYAESRGQNIKRFSALTIIGILLDTFIICTLTILIVLVTDLWKSGTDVSLMVQEALSLHFPYMTLFMPIFLFLLGYTTILAYFVVGIKCAKFLSAKWGPLLYYFAAGLALPLFALTHANNAFTVMSFVGALLLLLNLYGMFRLRKQVRFGVDIHK